MEWSGDRVTWYFKSDGENKWSPYSTFVAPKIDNPFFNIGVFDEIGPLAPLPNPPSGNANFLQFGLAETAASKNQTGDKPALTFLSPEYRSSQDGNMHLMTNMERVMGGNSHWKALWKWGGSATSTNSSIAMLDTISSCNI